MENLYRYHAYTLIDVTKTDVLENSPDNQKQRNQQRNWETVQQILSFRAQLLEFDYLRFVDENVSNYSFGVNYKGTHRIWRFDFAVERDDVYGFANDRYGALKDDFKIAPVILGLDETIKPKVPLFFASGPEKNIYFIAHKPE